MSANFVEFLGVDFGFMRDGRAELYLDVQPHHLNSAQVVHGGMLGCLADTVAGAAAASVLEKGFRVVTTDLHLTYLRNVGSGRIVASAELLHRGRRFLRADVRLRCGDALLATGGTSFLVVER